MPKNGSHIGYSLLCSRYQDRHAPILPTNGRQWGGSLRDDPNNGCEGDYVGYSSFPTVCSDSCFVEILTQSVSSILSVQTTSVLEEIVENVWKKVLMPQVGKTKCT